uniref:Uncharacterized protein n=1 Tax=Anguilla anguilla TaxID=7936 RepID=A0A0E9VRY5_ANGAN
MRALQCKDNLVEGMMQFLSRNSFSFGKQVHYQNTALQNKLTSKYVLRINLR